MVRRGASLYISRPLRATREPHDDATTDSGRNGCRSLRMEAGPRGGITRPGRRGFGHRARHDPDPAFGTGRSRGVHAPGDGGVPRAGDCSTSACPLLPARRLGRAYRARRRAGRDGRIAGRGGQPRCRTGRRGHSARPTLHALTAPASDPDARAPVATRARELRRGVPGQARARGRCRDQLPAQDPVPDLAQPVRGDAGRR